MTQIIIPEWVALIAGLHFAVVGILYSIRFFMDVYWFIESIKRSKKTDIQEEVRLKLDRELLRERGL